MKMYDYTLKFIIVGDAFVGKSCIASKFQNENFNNNYEVTIGVEFFSKIININNKAIKIQIWDTAGQETFRALISSYYRGAAACLLVFDITKKNSFDNLRYWYKNVKDNSNSFIIFTLVGNKSDLINKREVSVEEALDFANQNDMDYIETSALNSRNIYNVFHITADKIISNVNSGKTPIIGNQTIVINSNLKNNLEINNKFNNNSNCCL